MPNNTNTTDNVVSIDTSYGRITAREPDGNVIDAKNIDELADILIPKSRDYGNPKTQITTYVSDDDTISDASDLTMLAALCCWGKQLYKGDCIKLTITAEYCPENK